MDQPVNRVPGFRFGPFELDSRTGGLRKYGVRLRLPEQSYRVLLALLENHGNLVTREDLRQRLWDDNTFVDFEHGLNLAVTRLRQALGDSAENPSFVETIPRRGYRFIGSVESSSTQVQSDPVPVEPASVQSTVPNGFNAAERKESLVATSVIPDLPMDARAKTWRKVAFAAVIAVVVAGVIWRLRERQPGRGSHLQAIAVLPLTNLTQKGSEDYLAEGLTEELITELGRVNSLRVISRTSVMRYRATVLPLPQIGRELNVDAVVEGTFRRAADRVRITVQLTGIAPEHQIWSNAYDGDTQDLLKLQRQVAQDIALNVQAKLIEKPAKKERHLDLDTYEEYLRGRHFLANRDAVGITKAATYFQEAVRRDPQYAEAYAGLAIAQGLLAMYELEPAESFSRSKAYANKALELDSSLAEAYTARGAAASFWELNWPAAERDFQRAISLDAGSSIAHQWYGEHFVNVADSQHAVSELKRAHELDPVSLTVNSTLGRVYHDTRNYDAAIQQCKKAVDLYPSSSPGHWCLGLALLGKREYRHAVSELERANELGTTPLITRDLARAYAAAGRSKEARRILIALKQRAEKAFVPAYLISMIHGALGENDEAFRWLSEAYVEKDPHLPFLASDPEIDGLRSDPRFATFLQRLPPR
jgi:TolB-like protein/DNA-binding winged helix-turn-helix (wHTH) protein